MISAQKPIRTVSESKNGDQPQVSQINCDSIERTVSKLRRRISRCQTDENSLSCQYAKERITELANGYLNLNESPNSFFKINYRIPFISNLKEKVAQKLNLNKKRILIQDELSSDYEIQSISVDHSKRSRDKIIILL